MPRRTKGPMDSKEKENDWNNKVQPSTSGTRAFRVLISVRECPAALQYECGQQPTDLQPQLVRQSAALLLFQPARRRTDSTTDQYHSSVRCTAVDLNAAAMFAICSSFPKKHVKN
eukprot:3391627-Amphidinium_carterae.1